MHLWNDADKLWAAKNIKGRQYLQNIFIAGRMTMLKTGIARPGALQMLVATVAIAGCSSLPPILAAFKPSQEWLMVLTGIPAFLMVFAALMMFTVYCVGFLRYCVDKGYSRWLGLVLLLGAIPGFLGLLLLPDLRHAAAELYSDKNLRHAH